MKEMVGWILKTLLSMIFWVYVLSFSWEGKTLFERARGVFVDNAVTEFLTEEASSIYNESMNMVKVRIEKVAGVRSDKG